MKVLSISVLQLNQYIKQIFELEETLIGINVYGEVSNFKITNNVAYFDLKEEGASIPCVMFGNDVVILTNGQMVSLFGRLNFYTKSGKLSFVARKVQELGKGELYIKFLELKTRLENEGIFDQRLKKEIPKYSSKIGLVTSETGAVLKDILNVARRKNNRTDFILYPVKVQGNGAEFSIASAINYFSESDVDVIIVARGGGSFEDLAPFNTEIVAKAIFNCKKPIISAVGHETDFSISDFAADLRCATPSVASEMAVFDLNETKNKISSLAQKVCSLSLNLYKTQLIKLKQFLNLTDYFFKKNISAKSALLRDDIKYINITFDVRFNKIKNNLDNILIKLEKDNPLSLLNRGFIIASNKTSRIVSVNQIEVGENIDLKFKDGSVKVLVTNKEVNDEI